jgi:hypothetical protein
MAYTKRGDEDKKLVAEPKLEAVHFYGINSAKCMPI